ncbi:SHOCT domain-containing protein [Halomicrobium salinisoli]|uniref:SHOCT domain-containing protein n=1 Tax=Halomicrobium salinisoli TaxID=2878391 RepID=UPI001CF01C79|nr:SHOCT domain-containing protein [Halomicrobium salinisoli]
MSWVTRNRHWLLFAGFVLTTMAAVGAFALAAATALAGVVAGGLLAVADAVATYLLFGVLLLGLDVVLAVALVVTLASRVSLPESDRLAGAVGAVERAAGRDARFARRLEPSVETRRERLRERYVDGEITELEFERRLDDLLEAERRGNPKAVRGRSGDRDERDRGVEIE